MADLKEKAIKTRDFVRRLQRSDDRTKRRYVLSVSTGLMVIIVFLWLVYLNVTMPNLTPTAPEATSTAAASAAAAPEGLSFFGTFGRGAAIVWDDLTSGVGNIGNTIGGAWQKFQDQIQRTNTIQLNATSTP